MKRLVNGLISKNVVTPEDNITAYETWLKPSHASYTLNRYRQVPNREKFIK